MFLQLSILLHFKFLGILIPRRALDLATVLCITVSLTRQSPIGGSLGLHTPPPREVELRRMSYLPACFFHSVSTAPPNYHVFCVGFADVWEVVSMTVAGYSEFFGDIKLTKLYYPSKYLGLGNIHY